VEDRQHNIKLRGLDCPVILNCFPMLPVPGFFAFGKLRRAKTDVGCAKRGQTAMCQAWPSLVLALYRAALERSTLIIQSEFIFTKHQWQDQHGHHHCEAQAKVPDTAHPNNRMCPGTWFMTIEN